MAKTGIEGIAAGFPQNVDRYSQELCEKSPDAVRLANVLEHGEHHQPPEWVKLLFRTEVHRWYQQMCDSGIKVFECDGEPYTNAEEMVEDVHKNQRMFVRRRRNGPVAGFETEHWRAVHDYYGHVKQCASFTFRGELLAFTEHVVMFSRVCLPFVWNNVVLENSFRLVHGHFFCDIKQCPSKVVYHAEKFGPMSSFYR